MPNPSPRDPKFTDEPEGFARSSVTDDTDDTEGHKLHPGVTDDGTIPNAPDDFRQLASATDDGDDTEGHRAAL